jgi:hypothetical protein
MVALPLLETDDYSLMHTVQEDDNIDMEVEPQP